MVIPLESEEMTTKLNVFFRLVFGPNQTGYINVAYRLSSGWRERTFAYPDEVVNLIQDVIKNYKGGNTYFCPQLLESREIPPGRKSTRFKENVKVCTAAWADLDECDPKVCMVEPSLTVESSPGRYQAYWMFQSGVSPERGEEISKAIAYHHVPDGADKSGWDLSQLLRIPFTNNFNHDELQQVKVIAHNSRYYDPTTDFDKYIESRLVKKVTEPDPMPEMLPTANPLDILQGYRRSLNPIVFSLFSVEPSADADWSKILWQMISLCFEAGLTREEVFVVASASSCNKYKRDNRHPRLLWEEVCRGYDFSTEKLMVLVPETKKHEALISESELNSVAGLETFVERYVKWASGLGDAAQQYHHAAAFMTLSALLSGSVRLPTSFGTIMPNLWFMILADTTLTRKSTAMDLGMELADEVDPDVLLATDGSLEGLLQAMEARPGKPSVFLRDEFSGLLDAMTKKDYYAGMAETLTKLYDGKTMKRVLKRETITVREPCLLMFAGGIKNRVQSLFTLDHVSSGFVPRFIFVTAESDVSKLRPLGPPTMQNLDERSKLLEELQTLKEMYVHTQKITLKGALVGIQTQKFEAHLTQDAWERYNRLESTLLYAGVNSDQPDIMTPVYDRLAKSTLKAAVLIATSRMQEGETIKVEVEDLLVVLKYATHWRDYALEIVNGIGRSASEAQLQRIYRSIRQHPGVSRSRLMQWYHMNAREAEIIFATLEQRGLISGTRMGKTFVYQALGRE
jgi:uncharacterized protein DUF3987